MPGPGCEVLRLRLEKEIFALLWVELEVLSRALSSRWTERQMMMRMRSSTRRKRHEQPAPPETRALQQRR